MSTNCVLEIFSFLFILTVIKCDIAKATNESTGCPPGANCIENSTTSGSCICGPNNNVNPNYTASDKNSKYCIELKKDGVAQQPTTTTTAAPPPPPPATQLSTVSPSTSSTVKPEATTAKIVSTTTQKSATTSTVAPTTTAAPKTTAAPAEKTTAKPEDDVKVVPAAKPHHILGGIFLPMFIVLGFIGAVFAIKKYDLIERAHGYIRGRNQRERYSGLNENDFDDDPLLI